MTGGEMRFLDFARNDGTGGMYNLQCIMVLCLTTAHRGVKFKKPPRGDRVLGKEGSGCNSVPSFPKKISFVSKQNLNLRKNPKD